MTDGEFLRYLDAKMQRVKTDRLLLNRKEFIRMCWMAGETCGRVHTYVSLDIMVYLGLFDRAERNLVEAIGRRLAS